ncbi:MAG: 50S ribosomal protein L11 methyltransferase [Bacteroidetes bacterium]|nr:MAG: 50S ribosomal protein L11 methyltransferase [Bacteroidota bacterium]RLD92144.1 MAG: 50S ribosomal protein L11 methyltransferase [Bacteroidota bacterium]RLD93613.1 MAG: 50S ribosomal protein L11 methyltransferase [Bacteroidota bacterium]
MAYLEFVIPARSWSNTEKEILYALMAQIGFEGFVEGDNDIQAFIDEETYDAEALNQLIDQLAGVNIKVQYRFHRTEDQNWNEEWEKKFEPVVIDERVLIRAPFHDSSNDLEYTLVIEPKMSFGTGHHHTTKLMIREMGNLPLEGKRILDMGCGTGVLGIYACMHGAGRVLGVDNDQWAYENALENIKRNGITNMDVRLGDVGVLYKENFNMILANITRNTLVRDMSIYKEHLLDQGLMVISGILAEDVQYVLNEAYRCNLEHLSTGEESNWISLTFLNALP